MPQFQPPSGRRVILGKIGHLIIVVLLGLCAAACFNMAIKSGGTASIPTRQGNLFMGVLGLIFALGCLVQLMVMFRGNPKASNRKSR